MGKEIFRKVSIERLSSPEQLDQLIVVTSPRAWFSLIALGAILFSALVWGVFGSIPTKSTGEGILLSSGGIFNILMPADGQISDVRLSEGDVVHKGDIVARIWQRDVSTQINDAKRDMALLDSWKIDDTDFDTDKLSTEIADLYDLTRQYRDSKTQNAINETDYDRVLDQYNREVTTSKIQLEQARLTERKQKDDLDKQYILYTNGATPENDYLTRKKDYDLAAMEAQKASESLEQVTSVGQKNIQTTELKLKQSQMDTQLLEEKFSTLRATKKKDYAQKIDKLQQQLEFQSTIISPVDGRVVEMKAGKGNFYEGGSQLFTIEREGETIKELELVLYVPANDAKKIQTGMEAQIFPSTVKKEEYGYMMGKVIAVSEFPATKQGMMLTLGNETLVAKLADQGAPIKVNVELIGNPASPSGYKWSSRQGPSFKIPSGTMCSGSVAVEKRRPIDLVIPFLKEKLAIY